MDRVMCVLVIIIEVCEPPLYFSFIVGPACLCLSCNHMRRRSGSVDAIVGPTRRTIVMHEDASRC